MTKAFRIQPLKQEELQEVKTVLGRLKRTDRLEFIELRLYEMLEVVKAHVLG